MHKLAPIEIPSVKKTVIYDIIKIVFDGRGLTSHEIAEEIGMSRVTVNKVISEMIRQGRFCTEERISKRNAPSVYPADSLNILIFDFSKYRLSATLCDFRRRKLFSASKRPNESLAYEFDASSFANSLEPEISKLIKGNLCKVEIVCDRELLPNMKYLQNNMLNKARINERSLCIEEYIKQQFPQDCVMYAEINHYLDVKMFVNGAPMNREASFSLRLEHADGLEAINLISNHFSSVFQVVMPRALLVDSDILKTDSRFLKYLYDEIKKISRLSGKNMPDITSSGEIDFAALSIIGQVSDKFSKIFAGL